MDEAEAAKAYDEYAAKNRPVNFPNGTGTEKAKKRPAAERSSNIRRSRVSRACTGTRGRIDGGRIVVKGAEAARNSPGFNSFKMNLTRLERMI